MSTLHENFLNNTVLILSFLAVISTVISFFFNKYISAKAQKTSEDKFDIYKKMLKNQKDYLDKHGDIVNYENNTNISSYIPLNEDNAKAVLYESEDIMNIHQKQALMHSRVQFYTGIIISIIGFAIFVCILFLSLDNSNNVALGIKLTSSLIFEAVAILFLKESHKLRESTKEYHDNLRESSKQQGAIKITDSIQNEEIRSIIQAQLALHMIGIKPETIDITKILDSNNKVS
ncbi:hypothetical protein IGI01_18880 [Bacillus thuringiensis]|nr:hypothetical protein [Bacillus thuringiensis]